MEDESFVLQRTSPSSFPAIEILQDLHADHAPSNKVSLLLFFSCSYIVLLLLFRLSSSLISSHPNAKVPAPIIGTPFVWLSRISFFFYAKQTIAGAYRRCGKIPFKLCGNDVIVLPAKYINEIRNVPSEQLNSILALLENSEGEYSMTTVLAQSELHTTVIRTRLTPKLGKLMKVLRDEFMYGMQKDFPQCSTNKWIPVTAYPVLHGIVGRMAARAFVGPRLCRNEKWLHHAEGYTNSAFPTIILMRLIPDWLKRISSWILPTPWITKYHAYKAFQILLPEIDERRRILAKNATSGVEKPVQMSNEINDDFNDNFCSMMMKEAEGDEADPKSIAGRTLSLTLASNHTTTMALVEALYDLCLHLEYQNELREEVKHALAKHGAWSKETLTTMRKLDSFIRESRRMHPPSQMGFKRKALMPFTFSDGYTIPAGAHIEFAIVPIERDATANPDEFDGLRYYRRRLEPSQSHKWQFATTDITSLHFGHGRYACPGRFMAGNVIKLVLANLLLEYDFKFAGGLHLTNPIHQRPRSWSAFEYSFPNPMAKVDFKKRVLEN